VQQGAVQGLILTSATGNPVAICPQNLMKTINLLLANCDRQTNNQIEAAVLDACYNQAAVQCFRTTRVDELLDRGCRERFDLIIVAPNNLLPEPSRRGGQVTIAEVGRTVAAIKRQRHIHVVAVNVPSEFEHRLVEAGADGVLGAPFYAEALKTEVRQLLRLPEATEGPEPARWPFAWLFGRDSQRLKSA
jgi:hypothetical protein